MPIATPVTGLSSPVALIGLPGSGKSSVGQRLADRLGWAFADTDGIVEREIGLGIPELVAARGWEVFRRLEGDALAGWLRRERVVVATGGGAVESPRSRAALESMACTIWLTAPLDILLARLRADKTERPLLEGSPAQRLAALARAREPLYAGLARHRVDTRTLDPGQAVDKIVDLLAAAGGAGR